MPGRAISLTAALLLTVALLCGGGGTPSPAAEALIELTAIGALAFGVLRGWRPLAVLRDDPALGVLIGAVLLFPLIQLLPLPPAIWQELPGRAGARAAFEAAGEGSPWRPWSLAPDRTLAGALALVPAFVLALFVATLAPADRVRLLTLLTAFGLAAALLSIVQFIGGVDGALSPWADYHRGWGVGLFANRNAQATSGSKDMGLLPGCWSRSAMPSRKL